MSLDQSVEIFVEIIVLICNLWMMAVGIRMFDAKLVYGKADDGALEVSARFLGVYFVVISFLNLLEPILKGVKP